MAGTVLEGDREREEDMVCIPTGGEKVRPGVVWSIKECGPWSQSDGPGLAA